MFVSFFCIFVLKLLITVDEYLRPIRRSTFGRFASSSVPEEVDPVERKRDV